MAVLDVEDVKDRLNKTLTVDNAELLDMLDAAEAEYAELVGPLPGSLTVTLSGGRSSLILPRGVTAVTAAAYSDGTVIDVADLDVDADSGILHWGYGTAGAFTYGRRNVVLTVTIGVLPAHHREAILADVAGYFSTTQRGGVNGRPGFDSPDLDPAGFTPLVLFPRIRALAASYPAIA